MDWLRFRNQINLGITSYCNASCPLCERTHQIEDLHVTHLPFYKIKKNIENLPENINVVVLAGDFGDPLMHPDITKVISVCYKNHKQVRIHTNGGIRDIDWFKHIGKNYPQTEIIFGIDGTDHETNNKYRVGVDFEQAKQNMFEYEKYANHQKCVWQFIIFPWNSHQVKEVSNIIQGKNIFPHFIMNTRIPDGIPKHEEKNWLSDKSIFTLRRQSIETN